MMSRFGRTAGAKRVDSYRAIRWIVISGAVKYCAGIR